MLKPTLVKIYKVNFNRYDSDGCSKRVIKDGAPYSVWHEVQNKYILELPKNGPLLIPEYDLPFYSQFGDGYFEIEYVGSMYIPSKNEGLGNI